MNNREEIYVNLNSIYDKIYKKKQYTIPIFIPHMGCRHDCIFCNQRRISGSVDIPTKEDIRKQIEERLLSFTGKRNNVQIAFFGGSFTGISKKLQEEYLKTAYEYVKLKKVDSIRISTRPDYITREILLRLKKYGVKNIELGVQSMDDMVLDFAKRGHNSMDVIRAAKLIKIFGFNLGFQIMVGLPNSNELKEIETVKKLNKLKPDEYRIYPVYVIQNTELYDLYKKQEYIPLTLKDSIKTVTKITEEIFKTNAKIIRLGLQSTSEISVQNNKIYGPVCDNYAEYVYASLVLKKIVEEFSKKSEFVTKEGKKQTTIIIDKKIPFSWVVGPKKANVMYIKENYDCDIQVRYK